MSQSRWTRDDDKALENAVASLPPPSSDVDTWMQEIASRVPGRSLSDVRLHYDLLVDDVRSIEAGKVSLPPYIDDIVDDHHHHSKGSSNGFETSRGPIQSKSDQDRRKGIPWTEEEHKLFLLGLSKFGKGDWRSISRNFVQSRTPTQVASHAQKYFIRLNSMNRDRRRSSIHDITSINGGGGEDPVSPHQGPITGQNGGASPAVKPIPPPIPQPMMGVYAPVGQPVTGHLVSAVGTPVMLPHGHPPYVVPMAYPMPPPPGAALRR